MKRIDLPLPENQALLLEKSNNLASTTIYLEFASHITWDLGILIDDIVEWLNKPTVSNISMVGTLSSPQFLVLVKSSIEDGKRADFQRMIYAESRPTQNQLHRVTMNLVSWSFIKLVPQQGINF